MIRAEGAMDALLTELRLVVRSLRRSPGFSLVAVLILALGIGATVAVFSVVNGVLLAPPPYREPDRLVVVNHLYPSLDNLHASVSPPGFRDYSGRTDIFSSAVGADISGVTLTGVGEPERIIVLTAMGDIGRTFGVTPALGRLFTPDEASPGKDGVAVLSWGFFQNKFGGDSAVVGRSITLDAKPYRIIGVMPRSFVDPYTNETAVYAPLVLPPDAFTDSQRTSEFLGFIGRLAPGMTPAGAAARLRSLAVQLRQAHPADYAPDWSLALTPLADVITGGLRTGLLLVLGAVGLVLLIACANVANLLLARTAARLREVSVRAALGATPGRLVRHVLMESVVLALSGGVFGVLLALAGVPALLALRHGDLPSTAHVAVDLRVLLFALGVSLLTGVVFGFAPAIRLVRSDLSRQLREGGRAIGDRGGLALRRGLVVSTIALALVLLVGAGLLLRSFARVMQVDPGFAPGRLLTFRVSLPDSKYPNDTVRVQAVERLAAALEAVAGVQAAGATTTLPLSGGLHTGSFMVEGYQPAPHTPGPWGDAAAISPGFLPAIGAHLIAGRDFTAADRADSRPVCIVDEELAWRYWPGQSAIGKRITLSRDSVPQWLEIIGVIRHLAQEGLDAQARPQRFVPLAQTPRPALGFAVRTVGPPMEMAGAVGRAVHSIDPDLPLAGLSTMDAMLGGSLGARRFSMVLLGGFAVLALVLASIGLYGVMSYAVTQRIRELGVRLALGAEPRQVLGLVLRQGVVLAVAGVAIGLLAALAVTRLMSGMLYGIGATDPVAFIGTPMVLVTAALAACYFPARRATRVDPIEVLRNE